MVRNISMEYNKSTQKRASVRVWKESEKMKMQGQHNLSARVVSVGLRQKHHKPFCVAGEASQSAFCYVLAPQWLREN